jgi:hypothetical protein
MDELEDALGRMLEEMENEQTSSGPQGGAATAKSETAAPPN